MANLPEGIVFCECNPETNPGCTLGSHAEGHLVPAHWRASHPSDPGDEVIQVCLICATSLDRDRWPVFARIEHDIERVYDPWRFPAESAEAEEENRCPAGCECPRCGESNIDHLLIDLDYEDFIDCQTCGARYRIELVGVGQGFRAEAVESEPEPESDA